jgi:hypothetical protein
MYVNRGKCKTSIATSFFEYAKKIFWKVLLLHRKMEHRTKHNGPIAAAATATHSPHMAGRPQYPSHTAPPSPQPQLRRNCRSIRHQPAAPPHILQYPYPAATVRAARGSAIAKAGEATAVTPWGGSAPRRPPSYPAGPRWSVSSWTSSPTRPHLLLVRRGRQRGLILRREHHIALYSPHTRTFP